MLPRSLQRPVCPSPRETARAPTRAVEKFYGSDPTVTVDGEELVLHVGSESYVLDPGEATALREELGDALATSQEFVHTAGRRREDGTYVVARRGADSTGHRKVFDSFGTLVALYESLPAEFTAADVERTGLTGGRRHMVVRHLVEHPTFDCDLASRQPLTARKWGD